MGTTVFSIDFMLVLVEVDFEFKRFLQTGRKPSGLCGAALYISALSHGAKCTKSDIVSSVDFSLVVSLKLEC